MLLIGGRESWEFPSRVTSEKGAAEKFLWQVWQGRTEVEWDQNRNVWEGAMKTLIQVQLFSGRGIYAQASFKEGHFYKTGLDPLL